MISRLRVLCAAGLVSLAACGAEPEVAASLETREQATRQRLAAAAEGGGDAPVAKWRMPAALLEISGLALLENGNILAHDDQRGRVYVIDPLKGVILKWFALGKNGIRADFEAIAVSGSDIFMLVSNGNVYQFREGEDRASVPFTKHDTKLGKECEFESLEIEAGSGAFLLPCKEIYRKSDRDQLMIYRWLMQAEGEPSVERITVPLVTAIGGNDWKRLRPSDMTIDPQTGNYIVIAGPEKALIEFTPQWEVVRSLPLPGDPEQPEGVAITRDGIFIVASEGVRRTGEIALYSWTDMTGGVRAAASDTVDSAQTTASN
ncbi:MAG: hypothetical protein ACSLFK_13040 [Gemmatimonadaceae bacterium]